LIAILPASITYTERMNADFILAGSA